MYYNVGNPSMYPQNYGYPQTNDQWVHGAVLESIRREASAIDLYSRLANMAPDKRHSHTILQTLENKRAHLNQFSHLYFTLTGTQPMYQIDHVPFHSYEEGLKIAHEAELRGVQAYQQHSQLTAYPHLQNAFLHASRNESDMAARLASLNEKIVLKDYGSNPFVVNIDQATKQNNTFRTALWTGKHLQVTLMSIDVGDDIGLEVHPTTDQFLRIEEGQGLVQMGDRKDKLDFEVMAYDDFAIMVPAGKWHNITNTGNTPLKLYAIYAPPEHPYGTVHETKADAMASEAHHS